MLFGRRSLVGHRIAERSFPHVLPMLLVQSVEPVDDYAFEHDAMI
jgi:hypothetical protein